ncbi:MAG: hypothetical protein US52_C0033G0008 [candidate division WS6 bacterium GW2011_GWA2_37_6]|uniref:Uncharacterized protein n=1 Tax=candidate division WS6 bacterium GW2011_GWA2_37_6 TaxID=1619087 RepID=A0A0G0K3I0_9BACT|nr:MAG: hypothetical protein US52_C0033G0008 [candidate division WS6 bacterium GW2011_GWA2_37_6]
MSKSPFRVIFESCAGFFFTVLVLVLANLFDSFIDNYYYEQIVQFMNDYFDLVIIGSVIGLVANFVRALHFPFNTPSPLIHAINSLLFTYVLVRFLELVDFMVGVRLIERMLDSSWVVPLMYIGFFLLTFIGGMIGIFVDLFKHEGKGKNCEEKMKEWGEKKNAKSEKEKEEWEKWNKFTTAVKSGFKEFEKSMKEKKGKK